MAFGDLLDQVGGTGRFQIVHVTLLSIPVLMMASHNLLQNFVAAVPPHYCSAHSNVSQSQLSPEEILQITVPLDHKGNPHRCQRYTAPQWHLLDKNGSSYFGQQWDAEDAELQGCADGWSYNMTEMSSTIISDVRTDYKWDKLSTWEVCNVNLNSSGSFLCPRYGRRILVLISNLLMAVSGTGVAFSTSFSMYCLFRFGCGMALSVVEWIPTRVRTLMGTLTGYCYTVGQLILAVIAYFLRDWRWLTLAVSLPFYVFFLIAWWFHESARWLALNNKPDIAVKNLQSVAKFNGHKEEGEKINIKTLQESMKKELSSAQGSYTVLDLFRTPHMRVMTLSLSAVCFAYYGLAMDLQKFGVDIYLIQVIFGAVDIPAKIAITICMSFIGRRPSQCGALIIAGITILINLLVPLDKQTVRTCLAVVGKGCLAASFNCCYLYSGELYPTIIRDKVQVSVVDTS
uniref:Solute carrier family 22 member 6, like n=1 Tax=Salarias fasciatus TaxID=181472 RepID=A0A672GII3_SALFA